MNSTLTVSTLDELDALSFDEQWKQETARDFLRSWAERRGIESIDRNARTILIRTSIDVISEVLAERAIDTQRDIIGSEITLAKTFAFAYQIQGQTWSIVMDNLTHPAPLERDELAKLSKRLGQPIIDLGVSDTSGCISYELFEDGGLVEYFIRDEGGNYDEAPDERMQQINVPIPEEPNDYWKAYFWSSRRQITAEQVTSVWSFAGELILDYGAYDPAIEVGLFLEGYYTQPRKRYTVQQPERILVVDSKLQVKAIPPLVRVDYFRFD